MRWRDSFKRPDDRTWMVFDRYHSGFNEALAEQRQIAEEKMANLCPKCSDVPYDKIHDTKTIEFGALLPYRLVTNKIYI